MRNSFYSICFLVSFFLSSHFLNGQVESSQAGYSDTVMEGKTSRAKFADICFNALYPINTFGDILQRNLYGFSVAYHVERKNSDYHFWGFQVSYNHLGSDSNTFLGSGPNGVFDIDEYTSTNLWSVHMLYRIYPDFYFWRIEPFFEGALGTNMFITSTNSTFYDVNPSTQFNFNEFNMGLSYGLNVGFTLHIAADFLFISKFGYYSGNNTTYLVDGDNGSAVPLGNFNAETSQTNSLQLKLGLCYSFY
jgi:hypothetical protein